MFCAFTAYAVAKHALSTRDAARRRGEFRELQSLHEVCIRAFTIARRLDSLGWTMDPRFDTDVLLAPPTLEVVAVGEFSDMSYSNPGCDIRAFGSSYSRLSKSSLSRSLSIWF